MYADYNNMLWRPGFVIISLSPCVTSLDLASTGPLIIILIWTGLGNPEIQKSKNPILIQLRVAIAEDAYRRCAFVLGSGCSGGGEKDDLGVI